MAVASYIQRRDGRYHLQIRLSRGLAHLVGKALYRKSLGTTRYREAQHRLQECLGWIHRMNQSIDFVHLIQLNVRELQTYLRDPWPLSNERLFARKAYEEMFKNFKHKAIAAGFDPFEAEPQIYSLFAAFVQQNVDAEAHQQNLLRQQAYERGRAEALASVAAATVPASFQSGMPIVRFLTASDFEHDPARSAEPDFEPDPGEFPAPVREEASAKPDDQLDLDKASGAGPPSAPGQRHSLRFSEALDRFMAEGEGSKDAKETTRLIVQFLIDKLRHSTVRPCPGAVHRAAYVTATLRC